MEDYWRYAAAGRRGPFEWSATDPPGAEGGPSNPEGVLKAMAGIPEEQIWLEAQRSASTRRAYAGDMAQFVAYLGIHTPEELRLVERAAIIAFQRHLEAKGFRPNSISRKITTLSSLFSHLVCHRLAIWNPCRELRRPRRNRRQGSTPAFSREDARRLLDAPDPATLLGLRDRAILSLGLQNGPRRASIVALRVRDFYQDRGFDCLCFKWKGGDDHVLPIHPQTARRIREYLAAAGHADDSDGPLFRPLCPCKGYPQRRFLSPWTVNRIVKDYARRLAIAGRHTAHSMRATFITTALEAGAPLEEVQRAAGHANANTTRLYDRRIYDPARSATMFANY